MRKRRRRTGTNMLAALAVGGSFLVLGIATLGRAAVAGIMLVTFVAGLALLVFLR